MPTADTKLVPEVRQGMDGDVKTSEMRVGLGGQTSPSAPAGLEAAGPAEAIPRGVHWGIVRR